MRSRSIVSVLRWLSWRNAAGASASVGNGSGEGSAPLRPSLVDHRARGLKLAAGPAADCPHPGLRSSVVIHCLASSARSPLLPQDAGADAHQAYAAAWAQLFEHGQLLAEVVEVNGHGTNAVLLGQILYGLEEITACDHRAVAGVLQNTL